MREEGVGTVPPKWRLASLLKGKEYFPFVGIAVLITALYDGVASAALALLVFANIHFLINAVLPINFSYLAAYAISSVILVLMGAYLVVLVWVCFMIIAVAATLLRRFFRQ